MLRLAVLLLLLVTGGASATAWLERGARVREDAGHVTIHAWLGNGTFYEVIESLDVGERGIVWVVPAWNEDEPRPLFSINLTGLPEGWEAPERSRARLRGVGDTAAACTAPRRCETLGFGLWPVSPSAPRTNVTLEMHLWYDTPEGVVDLGTVGLLVPVAVSASTPETVARSEPRVVPEPSGLPLLAAALALVLARRNRALNP